MGAHRPNKVEREAQTEERREAERRTNAEVASLFKEQAELIDRIARK